MVQLMDGFPPRADAQVTLANWRNPPFARWAFQHVREIVPSADIANDPANVWALPAGPRDLAGVRIDAGAKARRTGTAVLARVETLLEASIALNPSADTAYGFLAEVKAELGRGQAAVAMAEKAVNMVPASGAHRLSMARVLLTLNRPAEAARVLEVAKVLARTPDERSELQKLQAEVAKRQG